MRVLKGSKMRISSPLLFKVGNPSSGVRYGTPFGTESTKVEVHSEAVNLDGFETHDTRRIIPGICFSIEPGIYLPEFGVRSEIDVFMSADGPYTSPPVQHEVVLIKGG